MDLRRLIVGLTLCSALIPFANTFYASYTVQREQLVQAALDGNFAYAQKLAKSTDDFLKSTLQQLSYTANQLTGHMDDPERLQEEAQRLRLQTQSFNSVSIFDAQGTVLATSPETLQLRGRTLHTDGVLEALEKRTPLISAPYMSAAGNFIVFISYPIRTAEGRYEGTVGGSIYLKQESILDHMLGAHFYRDGSYLYVVDGHKRIIYHPHPPRVGDVVEGNPVVDAVASGLSGSRPTVNSLGVSMLAGYASVPITGWGIVAQRPTDVTLAPLSELMRNVLHKTLPLAALTLLAIWWGAYRITQPLKQLAQGARTMDQPETTHKIQAVSSWYFEAQELKKAMLIGLGLLHKNISKLRQDVHTDPLTGLGNRRHLDAALATLQAQRTPFAVVAIDIDHFKHVNDTHGHDAGDAVLQQLALLMRDVCRMGDVPCRMGGEEFVMLLPQASGSSAVMVAERLRQLVEVTELPVVVHITISLGVAHWPESATDVAAVFKQADDMLYVAKQQGRNRTELHPSLQAPSALQAPALAPAPLETAAREPAKETT